MAASLFLLFFLYKAWEGVYRSSTTRLPAG